MSGNVLSIARTALNAHQAAVQVASQNISNAQTEGYSRQRVVLQAGVPLYTPQGAVGTGVVVRDVARARDALLDANFRRETGNAEGFGVRRELLAEIEEMFGEPSDEGLAATLDAFWNSWADLAASPTSSTARSVVQQRGAQLAFTLNNAARGLEDQARSVGVRLDASIREYNELAKQVADLNDQIVAVEVSGTTANDLRDARDRAIDAMSKLAPTRVIERANGSVAVLIGNATVVDGRDAKTIEMKTATGAPLRMGDLQPGMTVRIGFAGSSSTFPRLGGAVGAMVDVVSEDLPGALGRINALAAALVQRVNAEHDPGGSGVPFFDPAKLGAKEIRLSDAVGSSPTAIAAGTAGPGDNSVALALAQFRDVPLMDTNGDTVADVSFAAFYRDLITEVSLKVSAADRTATAYETVATQAETRRSSVSGVSIDEELIKLMHHQQAYTAATRLVTAADEMMQSILNMV